MTRARGFWHQAAGRGDIVAGSLAAPATGWCLVKTKYSAVSPGTERLVFRGDVPPELYEDMACPYMGGAFPFPVKYGYSLVGEVVASPGAPDLPGRDVHVLHPHQDFCLVRVEDVFPIPRGVPPARATLASNLETAVNAVWDSGITAGERALVVGFGTVGSLVARLISLFPGVDVAVAEPHPGSAELARTLGFAVLEEDSPSSFDLAFHASGSPEGLQTALDRVGFEGRVIELSWFGTKIVPLSLGGRFHSGRKSLQSSQVSSVAQRMRPRWDIRRRKELVFRLLEKPEFDGHITRSCPFSRLPEVFADFENLAGRGLSLLVTYEE